MNVVIVGGGSAGWMSAAILCKAFPKYMVSLIESPSVPTVGVGESTLGGINEFFHFLEIEEKDWMPECDASYKLSIKFTDFYKKGCTPFHYPFGQPYLEGTLRGLKDWMFKKNVYPETPVDDFVNSYFPASALFENNKYHDNSDGSFDTFYPKMAVAYHFDAAKFGIWLRDKYCKPRGVNHIVADIISGVVSDDGSLQNLVLDDGSNISADIFIDCTGFKSMILGGMMKEPFVSYDNLIPNNRAWATRIPYVDKEKELEGFTNSTAYNNGWVWNIPLWSRLGSGYVYSDRYISPEDALIEFKEYLKSDRLTIPRTEEQVNQLEFKSIEMRIGIHERTWVKNVVGIGLAAGFIEPLESNGLFSVHTFLFQLVKALSRGVVNQYDIDSYNYYTKKIFNNLAEFISLHYSLSLRDDTQYWKDARSRSYLEAIGSERYMSDLTDLALAKNSSTELSPLAGIQYISVGMEYLTTDFVTQRIAEIQDNIDYKTYLKHYFDNLEQNKAKWLAASWSCPSLYQWLRDNVHGRD